MPQESCEAGNMMSGEHTSGYVWEPNRLGCLRSNGEPGPIQSLSTAMYPATQTSTTTDIAQFIGNGHQDARHIT
jgi:hypothetical protein